MNTHVTSPVAEAAQFSRWAARAAPGAKYVYHVGNLAADRCHVVNGVAVAKREPIHSIAAAAMAAQEAGLVHLVQRRNGFGFDYIAIKGAAK